MSCLKPILLPLLFSCFVVAPGASAGELYKCVIDGQTKYQDKPCEKGAKATVLDAGDTKATSPAPSVEIASSDGPRSPVGGSGSVEGLFSELQVAQKQRDDLQHSYQQALARTTPLFASPEDLQQAEAQQARLKAEWEPRINQASERVDEAAARLNARCPTGVRFDKGRYSCNK